MLKSEVLKLILYKFLGFFLFPRQTPDSPPGSSNNSKTTTKPEQQQQQQQQQFQDPSEHQGGSSSSATHAIMSVDKETGIIAVNQVWTCVKCSYAYNDLQLQRCDICQGERTTSTTTTNNSSPATNGRSQNGETGFYLCMGPFPCLALLASF